MVKGTMNVKRLLGLALTATLISMGAASAATVTQPLTVKWNTQAVANLTLNTNYSAAGAQQLTAPAITTATNGSTAAGSCTATGAGSEVAATVNFGNVTPNGDANLLNCQYQNAVNAVVSTNSTNWSLTEAATAALPAGSALCAYANDTAATANSGTAKTFPFKASSATFAALQTQYGGAAVANNTLGTCTGGAAITTVAFNVISAASNAFTAATPANLGQDIELELNNLNATGAQLVTVNFVLTAN